MPVFILQLRRSKGLYRPYVWLDENYNADFTDEAIILIRAAD